MDGPSGGVSPIPGHGERARQVRISGVGLAEDRAEGSGRLIVPFSLGFRPVVRIARQLLARAHLAHVVAGQDVPLAELLGVTSRLGGDGARPVGCAPGCVGCLFGEPGDLR